jgi:hypothetical protein
VIPIDRVARYMVLSLAALDVVPLVVLLVAHGSAGAIVVISDVSAAASLGLGLVILLWPAVLR